MQREQDIRGFTILELLVVITIVAVVSAVGYPNFMEWRKDREVRAAAEKVATTAYEQGMRQAEVVVSGPGSGREAAIRALQGCGVQVSVIRDITPVPHNSCRPPKKRRV